MTVADKIAQRTAALKAIKADSNAAVAAKGGTTADNLSGIPAAIASIPTGGELPALKTPAEVGHVVAGKEYIDAGGNKQTGTLVVCDSVEEVETIGVPGVGLSVYIESPADGSSGELTLQEPNLLAENIKIGVSIFGVHGTAKTLRVETGTITPAEDTTTLSIPCSNGAKCAIVTSAVDNPVSGDMLGAFMHNIEIGSVFPGNCLVSYQYTRIYGSLVAAQFDSDGIYIPELDPRFFYRAGYEYAWTAYYWEDDT